MKITFQAQPKALDEKMVYNILRDYKILNCEVLVRDENGKFFVPLNHNPFLIPHSNNIIIYTSHNQHTHN